MILVNGVVRSEVSAMDRGLAYGDGVFRTFLARGGTALHWHRHYAKLVRDCAALRLRVPDRQVLEADVKAACGDDPRSTVKIVITRGPGRRGYGYAGDEAPTRIVHAEPGADTAAAQREDGIKVRLCSTRLACQPALAGVKHLNRLENVLARAEWTDAGIAEGLMCDASGNMIGGTMTNIFIAANGVLATPRLDECGVAGVTRERVLDAAARLGLQCAITSFTVNEVLRAEEVFLVNSVSGVWPVRDLDGEARQRGRITRAVQLALQQEDDAQVA
jgi:4-amino-4-deoxychorismate lyase